MSQETPSLRVATLDDIPTAVDLCREFHSNTPYSKIEFSEAKCYSTLEGILNAGGLVLLHSDDGILVAVSVELPFTTKKIATELAWYHRGGDLKILKKLQEAFEYWARNIAKASNILSGSLNETHWFTSRGYEKAETMYIASLE